MFKDKRQQYKKSIRKQQINDFFTKKRKQFMSQHLNQSRQNSKIEQEVSQFALFIENNQNSQFNLEQLKSIAEISSTSFGITLLIKLEIAAKIIKYLLDQKYTDSKQQEYVSLVYANILFLTIEDQSKVPPKELTSAFMRIMQFSSNLETQQNCLIAIYHLVHDYELVRVFAMKQLKIVDFLYKILDQNPQPLLVSQCLKILYALIKTSHSSNLITFKKFIKFMCHVLMNSNEAQFVILSTFNIHQVLIKLQNYSSQFEQIKNRCLQQKNIPIKLSDIHEALSSSLKLIINMSGLNKIMRISKTLALQDYYLVGLDILQISLKQLKPEYVQKNILPYLKFIYIELQNKIQNQSFNEMQSQKRTNKKLNIYKLKIKCNELVYRMVNCDSIQLRKVFTTSQLFSYLLLNLQEQTDELTVESLIYPFGLLLLSRQLDHNYSQVVMRKVDSMKNRMTCNEKLDQFIKIIDNSFHHRMI